MKSIFSSGSGITVGPNVPPLHPRSWIESPAVIQATLAPHNLIQIGAFTGVYGGRVGHCKIGRYCSIAPGVDIASDQHPIDWLSTSMFQYVNNLHGWGDWLKAQGSDYESPRASFNSNAQVEIGNDVWIGQGVFIKSGVVIGDGAIVAAHSVVINDIPPYAIVAGVPATVKRYRFEKQLIDRYLELKWWDYNLVGNPKISYDKPQLAVDEITKLIERGELEKYIAPMFKFDKD